MSKYEIKNGIIKTPVFHGSKMFFVKRKIEVGILDDTIASKFYLENCLDYEVVLDRPFIGYDNRHLHEDWCFVTGVMLNNGMIESIDSKYHMQNEIVLRN